MKKKHLFNRYLKRRIDSKSIKVTNAVILGSTTHTKGPVRAVTSNAYLNFTFWEIQSKRPKSVTNSSWRGFKSLSRTLKGPQFLKFKYVGKSYRVKYKEGVIFLKFNRAHRTTLFLDNVTVKPFKRLWFSLKTWYAGAKLARFVRTIASVRKRNLYTKRGLWLRKSLSFKKRGKVSAYR